MIKKLFILLALVNLLFANNYDLTQAEKNWINSKKVIKISNELNFKPYTYQLKDKTHKGYFLDFIKVLAKEVGLKVEYVSGYLSSLEKSLDNGSIDIIAPAIKTTKKEKVYTFSEKTIKINTSIITKKDKKPITSIDMLKGKEVAIIKGRAITKTVLSQYKGIKYIEYSRPEDALKAVSFGLVDAYIEDYHTARIRISNKRLANLHVTPNVEVKNLDSNLYLQTTKDNKILIAILEKASKKVDKQILKQVKDGWFNYKFDPYAKKKVKKNLLNPMMNTNINPWAKGEKFGCNAEE